MTDRKHNIAISLTLEQWVAVMGSLLGKELSTDGAILFDQARTIIADGIEGAVKEPRKVKLDKFA